MGIEVMDKTAKQICREIDDHNAKLEERKDRSFTDEITNRLKDEFPRLVGIKSASIGVGVCPECHTYLIRDNETICKKCEEVKNGRCN